MVLKLKDGSPSHVGIQNFLRLRDVLPGKSAPLLFHFGKILYPTIYFKKSIEILIYSAIILDMEA